MQKNFLQILFRFFPNTSAYFLLNHFLSPPKRRRPKKEQEFWQKGHKLVLKNGIHARLYNPGPFPLVVFVHGWGGRGSQYYSFIDPLVENGYFCMLIDGPSHGDTPGSKTNLVSFTKDLVEGLNFYNKEVEAIIGHSFGGLSVLLSARLGLKAKKRITIGSPYESKKVISNFVNRYEIPDSTRETFIQLLESEMKMSVEKVDSHPHFLSKECKYLIIQDKADKEVPEERAHLLNQAYKGSKLYLTEGQGHFRILRSKAVIEKVLAFLA